MDPRIPVILRMRRGAGWFLTIGVLSGVNALLQILKQKSILFLAWASLR